MSNPEVNIGIVGATGLVGEKILETLDRRNFPVGDLRLFASERSAGKKIEWRDQAYAVENAEGVSATGFEGLDYVFLSAGGDATKSSVSKELCPKVAEAGAIAIDNSSAFRSEPEVPLVVSEVNPEALDNIPKGIVANPNCTTMVGMLPLKPLHDFAELNSINVKTYQSVSGQGKEGVDKTLEQINSMGQSPYDLVNGNKKEALPSPDTFPTITAFNVGPLAGSLDENGSTSEEVKFIYESRKILGLAKMAVSATCVRVPVLNGHSLAISAGFEQPISTEEVSEILHQAPGLRLVDVPQPLYAAGEEDVLVGRLRADPTRENGLEMFVSGDNLLKGAALNAVQIAELLVQKR